jgi:hypothetical protein
MYVPRPTKPLSYLEISVEDVAGVDLVQRQNDLREQVADLLLLEVGHLLKSTYLNIIGL